MADTHPEVPTHTLGELAGILPKPDAATIAACTADLDPADLVRRGAQVASSRVIVDARRVYAQAHDFWVNATAEQQEQLVGFSPELLAVAVDRALALQELVESAAAAGTVSSAERAKLDHSARTAFSRGIALRDQAARVLRTVAGRGSALEQKVLAVTGTAAAEALAAGLEALARVANELLAKDDAAIKARVQVARLSEKYARQLSDAAQQVRSSSKAATIPRPAPAAAQSELDLLDGVNLVLLGDVIRAFESAHDIDPTIPRLVPISTRRLLGRRNRRKEGQENPTDAPTPGPANP